MLKEDKSLRTAQKEINERWPALGGFVRSGCSECQYHEGKLHMERKNVFSKYNLCQQPLLCNQNRLY
jgi:hypothetical protein